MSTTMQPYVPGKRQPAHMPKGKLSRWSELKIWWREIDRVLLLLVCCCLCDVGVTLACGVWAASSSASGAGAGEWVSRACL